MRRSARGCTTIVDGTVSERPKVQLSKSCVGVEPTVGSNPTGSARGLLSILDNSVLESQPNRKSHRIIGGFFSFQQIFCHQAQNSSLIEPRTTS